MSKPFKTNKGTTYCVTVPPTGGTVIASYIKNNVEYTVTLVNATEAGQHYFCAPSWLVILSDSIIDITPVNGGSSGVGGGSGSSDGFIPEVGTTV